MRQSGRRQTPHVSFNSDTGTGTGRALPVCSKEDTRLWPEVVAGRLTKKGRSHARTAFGRPRRDRTARLGAARRLIGL